MPAVGGYLRVLREGRHITRSGLAGELDVDPTTLWRIEEGKQEPSGGLMIGLVRALQASLEDMHILFDRNATIEQAEQLAQRRLTLTQAQLARIDSIIDQQGDEEAEQFAEELLNNPEVRRSLARAAAAEFGKHRR